MSENAGGPGKPGRSLTRSSAAVIRSLRITAADGKVVFIDASHDNEAGKDQTFKELGHE